MGFWGTLGKIGGAIGAIGAVPFTGGGSLAALGPILGAAGAGLGAISQAQASNRGEKFGGQMDLERLLMERDQQFFNNTLAREQDGRAGQSDAFRKLLAASHVSNPGPRPQLSPYSIAPRQASEAELSGADALTQQVLARLQGGNPIAAPQMRPTSVDPKLLNPGLFERIAGYASPVLGTLGAMQRPPLVNNSRLSAINYLQQAPRV